MADVAEIIEEVPVAEKEVEKEKKVDNEKKVVEVEDEKSNDAPVEEEHKQNGSSEKLKNGDAKAETNGVNEDAAATNKRKSGAADTPETVDGTPEKKAKIVAEENEESNSTNGSSEVAVA